MPWCRGSRAHDRPYPGMATGLRRALGPRWVPGTHELGIASSSGSKIKHQLRRKRARAAQQHLVVGGLFAGRQVHVFVLDLPTEHTSQAGAANTLLARHRHVHTAGRQGIDDGLFSPDAYRALAAANDHVKAPVRGRVNRPAAEVFEVDACLAQPASLAALRTASKKPVGPHMYRCVQAGAACRHGAMQRRCAGGPSSR